MTPLGSGSVPLAIAGRGRASRAAFAVLGAVLALMALGCASVSAPGSPPPTPRAFVVERTGGFAGQPARLSVTAQGAWTFDAGTRASGTFTADENAHIAALLADPGLAAEQSAPRPAIGCADTYTYTVTAGTARYVYDQCFQETMPRIRALIDYLAGHSWSR